MVQPRLQIELLGPLRILADGHELQVGAPKQRAVLTALAFSLGQTVSYTTVIDRVWGDDPPATARGILHTYVSGLRSDLGSHRDALTSSPAGYVLRLEDGATDEEVVRGLVAHARSARHSGDQATALDRLDEALDLWRAPEAVSDVPGPFAAEQRARLAAARLGLLVDRTELVTASASRISDVAEAADRLAAEVSGAPYDERLRVALMQALAGSGRAAAALEHYDDLRRTLAEELGIDPSPQTKRAHATILATESEPARPAPDDGARSRTTLGTPVGTQVPAQLPAVDGAFVGREDDLAELVRSCDPETAGASRIAAVVGIGGVGKTSLAVRAGHAVRDRFPDGQVYVNLRGFDARHPTLSPAAALIQLLASLGVMSATQDHQHRVALWRSVVAERRMLIVLDNAASAQQVEDLLPGAAGCFVLVTSRDRLSGLSVRHGARRITLGPLDDEESVHLLAAAIGTDTAEAAADPAAVQRLVELCDHLPFALRVAAEQIGGGAYGIRELVTALEETQSRLDVLQLSDDTTLSVRAALACSDRVLGADASRALRLVAWLPGGTTTALATAALLDTSAREARRIMDQLCAQHLLSRDGDHYTMHDLTRAYGAELALRMPDQELTEALGRLLRWYADAMASGVGINVTLKTTPSRHELPQLSGEEDLSRWRLRELPMIVALIRRGQALGHHERVWQLAVSLFPTFWSAGNATEWLDVLEVASRSANNLHDPYAAAVLLNHESVAHDRLGHTDLAVERLREALALLDDTNGYRVILLANLAATWRGAKNYDEAMRVAHEALELAQRFGEEHAYALAAVNATLCELNVDLERWTQAVHHGTAGLRYTDTVGRRLMRVSLLIGLGLAHSGLGDLRTADEYLAQALALSVDAGDLYDEGMSLFAMARVRLARGDGRARQEADNLADRALRRLSEVGEKADVDDVRAFRIRLARTTGSWSSPLTPPGGVGSRR